MNITRRQFLGMGAIGIGAALTRGKSYNDNTVYIPVIQNTCDRDFVKLAEYIVPQAGFTRGFIFVEFPDYKKYILDISANITSDMAWFPSVQINDNPYDYLQLSTIMMDDGSIKTEYTDQEIAIVFPVTTFRKPEQADEIFPYSANVEITNVPGMYKYISARGNFPIDVLGLVGFLITGTFRSSDPISQIDLFANFPTGLFGPGTTISLYGVR